MVITSEQQPIKKDEEYYMQKHKELGERFLDHIKCDTSEQLKQEIDKVIDPIVSWMNNPKTKQYSVDFWNKGELHKDDEEYEKESGHFYSESAEAITKVMVLASNYVYRKMGSSGFQAGWADMQYLGVRRYAKFGLMLLEADDILFPQFKDKVDEWKNKVLNEPHVIEYLKDMLEESIREKNADPRVQLYWHEIIQAYENKEWFKNREAEYEAARKKWRDENPDWNKWGTVKQPDDKNLDGNKIWAETKPSAENTGQNKSEENKTGHE